MIQSNPMNSNLPAAPSEASNYEMRYATYRALEKLKSTIWMDYDHAKPTIAVCVWDGAGAVDSINVFTSFESAVERNQADIRVVLQEIDGTNLEDQTAIVFLLPIHELYTRVTPEMTPALTDHFIAQLRRQEEESQRIIRSRKGPKASAKAVPTRSESRNASERPVFLSGTEPKFPFFQKKRERKEALELRAPIPEKTDSPLKSALTALSNELIRKYPADENHVVICTAEGRAAAKAVSLYTAIRNAAENENIPLTIHIKKIGNGYLRHMSPIVLTAPTEAVYLNVHAEDADNIVRRTVMRGEILEALTFQESAGVTPRSLSITELTDLASIRPESEDENNAPETKPDPIALLVPGKAVFRDDARELLETPEIKEMILYSTLKPESAPEKARPSAAIKPTETDGGESGLMTVEALFAGAADIANETVECGTDPVRAGNGVIHAGTIEEYDAIREKSATVNPLNQPQLLVIYGTDDEREAAAAFAAELRESSGLIDIKISLSAALGIPGGGVSLRIDPAGILYTRLRRSDSERIMRMTVADGIVLPEFLARDPRSGKRILLYKDHPWIRQQTRLISADFAAIASESLSSVINHEGYRGSVRALTMRPDEILTEIKSSRLRGRGGAGFPAWRKLELAAAELAVPKTVLAVCADWLAEAILARAPHLVLEGMIIAARAIGAKKGVLALQNCSIYTKKICQKALRDATVNRLVGSNILQSGFRFDLSILNLDGVKPIGDESAIIAALSAGNPKAKTTPQRRPPYPTQSGINGKPTAVFDVRTIAALPAILREGAAVFAVEGTRSSGGTFFIAIRARGKNFSLAEIPIGRRLDVLLLNSLSYDERKRIKGARLGDRHPCYLSADQFHFALDETTFETIQSPLPSVIEWLDESENIPQRVRTDLKRSLDELGPESRMSAFGLEALIDRLDALTRGEIGAEGDLLALRDLAEGVRDMSQTRAKREAVLPLISALAYFPDDFRAFLPETAPKAETGGDAK